jgi:hypothetical protein
VHATLDLVTYEEQPSRWCASLPYVGEEPITSAQRGLLERVYRVARVRLAVYAMLLALLLPGSMAVGYLLHGYFGSDSFVPLAFSVAVFFFALPLCIAKALVQLRIVWPMRRDLSTNRVWIFEGSIAEAPYEDEDPDVVALVKAGTLVRGATTQRLGLLPLSGRLVHVSGRDVLPERRLHVAMIASAPERTLRYSLPPDVKQSIGAGNALKRRRFMDGERSELSAHIARLTSLPWMLVVLTVFVAITVSFWATHGVHTVEHLLGLGWIVAWMLVATRHIRGYLLARRLENDLEVGWLLSWEPPEDREAPGARAHLPFKRAEVLPVSQMDWMIDGKPAPWRRVIQRA